MLHDLRPGTPPHGASDRVPPVAYERLQRMYSGDGFYWGREPNDFARLALTFAPNTGKPVCALDLGAGEGRDSVLFAAHGLDTLAVDISENALGKARRLAAEKGVVLRTEPGDVNAYEPGSLYDVIYSVGTVQYIAPENREQQFDLLKQHTKPDGINAVFTFINRPGVPPAPDFEEDEHPFSPGELGKYYEGWEVLYERHFIFDDASDGIPHQHAAEEYVFKNSLGDSRQSKAMK